MSTIHINQLPNAMYQSILNYISPREAAVTVQSVQKSWQHLTRNDRCLDLSNSKIKDTDLEQIFIKYQNQDNRVVVVSLDLSDCAGISDMGLQYVAVASLTSLETLNLRGSRITDDGLPYLIPLRSLEELDLSRSRQIGNKGFQYVASLTSLKKLSLGCTRITDDDLPYLIPLRSLEELNISCSGVTSKGLEHLTSLTSLKKLDLTGTRIAHVPDSLSHVDCLTTIHSYFMSTARKMQSL